MKDSFSSCFPNKFFFLTVIIVGFYLYWRREEIGLVIIEEDVKRFVYGINSIELNDNYTIGKTKQVTDKELKNQRFYDSEYRIDDIFRGMENTLRSTKSLCIAMHHYKLNEYPKQLVGILINNRTDFVNLINPKIETKSINEIVNVIHRNNTISRYQYVTVSFYYDLFYAGEYSDDIYVHNGEKIILKKKEHNYAIQRIFDIFYKSHIPKKRFVKMEKRFHNEYSICIQNIIAEF